MKPTQQGFYWVRNGKGRLTVVKVSLDYGKLTVSFIGNDMTFAIDDLDDEEFLTLIPKPKAAQ